MVEEIPPPGDGANPRGGVFRWLTRLLVGMLGLSAAARYLLATPPQETPATVSEEAPHPDVEEVRHPDGRIEHPHVRFEHTDASLGWILAIGIGSMALAALIFSLLLWFFFHYKDYQAAIKRSPFPLAPHPSEALPAPPHLEQLNRIAGIEKSNVYEREAGKESLLHSYGLPVPEGIAAETGKTPPENGFVRIPIEQAMAWVVQAKKLPARQEPPPSTFLGASPVGAAAAPGMRPLGIIVQLFAGQRFQNQRQRGYGLVDAGESNSGRMFREEPRWYSR
jgi:hypothetical protein